MSKPKQLKFELIQTPELPTEAHGDLAYFLEEVVRDGRVQPAWPSGVLFMNVLRQTEPTVIEVGYDPDMTGSREIGQFFHAHNLSIRAAQPFVEDIPTVRQALWKWLKNPFSD